MLLPTDENVLKNQYQVAGTKRVRYNGETSTMTAFKIPIEYLYFNDENGRIAIDTGEYKSTHPYETLDELRRRDLNTYNDIVGRYIKESANDNTSFRKTKQDIREKGQIHPGVILPDGRVIDGNRRFAAVRELASEGGVTTFDCVVLPVNIRDDGELTPEIKRIIKELELDLQFAEDPIQSYDPIDRHVSFYRDTIDPRTAILTRDQYIKSSNMKPADYNKEKAISEIMVDYLKWREIPEKFYVLKEEKLDPAIEEIVMRGVHKLSNDEKRRVLDVLYPIMTLHKGDKKTCVRRLIESYKKGTSLFLDYERDTVGNTDARTKIDRAIKDCSTNRAAGTPEESREKKQRIQDAATYIATKLQSAQTDEEIAKTQQNPLDKIEKALKLAQDVTPDMVRNLNTATKELLKNKAKELKDILEKLENVD